MMRSWKNHRAPKRVYPREIFLFLSIVGGLILTAIPFPLEALPFLPFYLPVIMLFWMLFSNEPPPLGWNFILGLFLDSLMGSTLGLHAFALTLFAYLCSCLRKQFRHTPTGNRVLWIILLLLLYQTAVAFLSQLFGIKPVLTHSIAPILTSLLFWPLVYFTLAPLEKMSY